MEREFGAGSRDRYFAILEELRAEFGYSDYLGALQRYRLEDMCDPRLLLMSFVSGGLSVCKQVVSWFARCP